MSSQLRCIRKYFVIVVAVILSFALLPACGGGGASTGSAGNVSGTVK